MEIMRTMQINRSRYTTKLSSISGKLLSQFVSNSSRKKKRNTKAVVHERFFVALRCCQVQQLFPRAALPFAVTLLHHQSLYVMDLEKEVLMPVLLHKGIYIKEGFSINFLHDVCHK
jgi:hypothetical protein